MSRIPSLLVTLLLSCATARQGQGQGGVPPNPLASYLCGAELQAESDAQRESLRGAFTDVSRLPVADLRARRYADYQGTPNQWDLLQLLDRHFVPAPNHPRPDPEAFWKLCDSHELRAWAGRAALAVDAWNTQRPEDLCRPLGP